MDAEQRGAAKSKYHDIINALHCKIAINKEGHDRFKFKILKSLIHSFESNHTFRKSVFPWVILEKFAVHKDFIADVIF